MPPAATQASAIRYGANASGVRSMAGLIDCRTRLAKMANGPGMNDRAVAEFEAEPARGWWRTWPRLAAELSPAARGRVRLRTLNNLRWMAVAGQSAALFIVYFALNYPLPLFGCVMAIGASVALNLGLAVRYPAAHRLTNREATAYLAYDVLQLAALLYFTGGIQNPFALMFIAPVVIGAA